MKADKRKFRALGIVRKYHPEVNRVVDATENVEIEVTAEDCRIGRSKAPAACAMARACGRKFDGAIISIGAAYLIKGGKAMRYKVPPRLQREIVSFDRSKVFAPGTYNLLAPSVSVKLGVKPKHPRPNKSGGSLRHHIYTTGIRAI